MAGSLSDRHRWNLRDPEATIIENAAETVRLRGGHDAPLVVHDQAREKILGRSASSPEVWEYLERQQDELAASDSRPSGPMRHSRPFKGVLRVS
jgi:hypothetical protein